MHAQVSAAALALFAFGQAQAAQRGLLLVDTKYEFGLDADGQIRLVDEIHTPDSSRHAAMLRLSCAPCLLGLSGTAQPCAACCCRARWAAAGVPRVLASACAALKQQPCDAACCVFRMHEDCWLPVS